MIRIQRGIEPVTLAAIRAREVPLLRKIGNPIGAQIPTSYKAVAYDLWEQQFHKCCYCEKVVQQRYNDVEHYRPKGRATRIPGCAKTHGYWWLAYTWKNLIFACPNCNRSEKNDEFPLDIGSTSLLAEEDAPGAEIPLLIDPAAALNPVEHIEFVLGSIVAGGKRHWWAHPRNGSNLGNHTIRVCGLNRGELLELRTTYVRNYVEPQINKLKAEIAALDFARSQFEFRRAQEMMSPRFEFAALTYDAFRAEFRHGELFQFLGIEFPDPSDACK